MSEDYRAMWTDLGLDLDAHDALLGALGQGYQDIYLSQKDRPVGQHSWRWETVRNDRVK